MDYSYIARVAIYVTGFAKIVPIAVTKYLVRVHKWSGRTIMSNINGPPGPLILS